MLTDHLLDAENKKKLLSSAGMLKAYYVIEITTGQAALLYHTSALTRRTRLAGIRLRSSEAAGYRAEGYQATSPTT